MDWQEFNKIYRALMFVTVNEPDLLDDPVGSKGFVKIAIMSFGPAIANAVFIATGKRIRDYRLRQINSSEKSLTSVVFTYRYASKM